jgi:uncharacterized membrane protein (UPF0136 family)
MQEAWGLRCDYNSSKVLFLFFHMKKPFPVILDFIWYLKTTYYYYREKMVKHKEVAEWD